MIRRTLALLGASAVFVSAASGSAARSAPANGLLAYVGGKFKSSDIYVVDSDGSGRRRLTSNSDQEVCPTWAPDGKRIAVLRVRGKTNNVDVLASSGTLEWTIPGATCLGWSPDGSRLLLFRDDGLYVVAADGSALRSIGVALEDVGSWPSWSPDGTEIAFVSSYSDDSDEEAARRLTIVIVEADGPGTRTIKVKAPKWCTGFCRLYTPYFAWAPGKDIAFVLVHGDLYPQVLFAIRPDGTGQRPLSGNLKDVYVPAWSHDGRRISFTYRGRSDQIWVAKSDGTGVRQVTRIRSKGGHLSGVFDHVWSPDGTQIAAFGWGGGIYAVDVVSGKARKIATSAIRAAGVPQRASWQPLP
jgi:Tol biopolymer transport system component